MFNEQHQQLHGSRFQMNWLGRSEQLEMTGIEYELAESDQAPRHDNAPGSGDCFVARSAKCREAQVDKEFV
jgi:hypothetical protein